MATSTATSSAPVDDNPDGDGPACSHGEVARFFADEAICEQASDLTLFYGKERIENSSPPE